MRRLRCLIVTFGLPYPPHSGSRLRYYHLLRALAAHCDLYLLSLLEFPDEAQHLDALRPYCRRIETVNAPARSGWRARLASLTGLTQGWPLPFQRYHTAALGERLRAIVEAEAIDIVQIENLELASYVYDLPPATRAKRVLALHNVGARQYQLPSLMSASAAARQRAWLKWRLLVGWDARLALHFDAVVTVSAVDEQRLVKQLPIGRRPRLAIIPNGVDVAGLQPLPPAAEPVLLFVGTLGYEPNIDAAQFFATQVLPRVQAAVPATRLVIAGQHPAPGVLALAHLPGVSVIGAVPDLQPVYQAAQVVVVPLRAGGGTRLKILEALALGRPVVSTTIGAEGLDLIDGLHLRLADGAEALAEAIVALLRNPDELAALAQHGRERVTERYAWPQLAEQALALYQTLLPEA